MKHLILLACGLVLVSLPIDQPATELPTVQVSNGSCVSDHDLAQSLKAFSSGLKPEVHRETLSGYARRSPECRAKIITALLRAMDKPGLNMEQDQDSFFLWHFGGELLSELRATEALDLLVANLGITDGTSINFSHYPALETVIGIGEGSIPKLSEKLKHEERPEIRKLAVYCIGWIGGKSAKQALAEALPNEKDKCVSNFIQFFLKSFQNRKRPNHMAVGDYSKWSSAFTCTE